jgi:hypothetical protein
MKETRLSIADICYVAVYELINVLFVYKYASRITSYPWGASLLYLVILSLFILFLFQIKEFRISSKAQNIIYFSMIAFCAIGLAFLMLHFNPQKIRVGRYLALEDWITRFFHGEFPYASHTYPSGLPFLFVLAMPFYLLGDSGFFQIFSFLIFAILVHLRHRQNSINRFRCIFLLITAPIFLYEIVVRSDLISNMVMVTLYLAIFELFGPKASRIALCLLGIIGGFLLSTRGIVLLIYIPVFGYFFRGRIINSSLFILSMLFSFSLTLVPLAIWDWKNFIDFGPFFIQLSYAPNWLLILAIASSVFCALIIRSLKRIYSAVSFILFGVTGLAFVMTWFNSGWDNTVLRNGFDISYFAFALPFLLISLEFTKGGTKLPDYVFALHSTGERTPPEYNRDESY